MSEALTEKFEKYPATSKVLGLAEFARRIYPDGSLDKRFLPIDQGGVFKWLNIDNLDMGENNIFFPIVEMDNKIVGVAAVDKHPYQKNIYRVRTVDIDPKYRDNKYGSKLIEEIFKFAKDKNCALKLSQLEDDGKKKLKNVIQRLADQTGIKVIYNPLDK